jgi:hypothetical protein
MVSGTPAVSTTRAELAHPDEEDHEPHREDDDDTPETPLDEPLPPRVQDPPPQRDEKGPYVVSA